MATWNVAFHFMSSVQEAARISTVLAAQREELVVGGVRRIEGGGGAGGGGGLVMQGSELHEGG